MKNRKKNFVFVLLLCTFFSTLLIVNPTIKAETTTTPPGDLTGYTVTVPSGWNASGGVGLFLLSGTFAYYNSIQSTFYPNYYFYMLRNYNFVLGYTADTSNNYNTISSDNIGFVYKTSTGALASNNYTNTSNSFRLDITGGVDSDNPALIQWLVDNNATFTNNVKIITFNALNNFENYSSNLQYSFNSGETWQNMGDIGFPTTFNGYNSVDFRNNDNDLTFTISNDTELLRILAPGETYSYTIVDVDNLYFDLYSLPTYTISGGYMFNPTISSSIFGDYTEQLIDIRLSNNFYLYDLRLLPFNQFSIYSDSENPNILYFTYVNTPDERTTYAGTFTNNGNIITNVAQRTIYFEEQEVSEELYTWLTNNGRFGNFDNTLPEPSPDNPFSFVVDMVNDFLQIEFLPGLRFIHLLYIGVSIPLCIFILKLFLGG